MRRRSEEQYDSDGGITAIESLAGKTIAQYIPSLNAGVELVSPSRRLFLTQEAHLAGDHVHRDAENIEHVLPRDMLTRLEQMLDNPTADPHGRPIP